MLFPKTITVNPLVNTTRTLLPELKKLKEEIAWAMSISDPLTGLVAFFNITSPWHDRGPLVSWHDESDLGKSLKKFYAIISNAGRCSIGWNRTKAGELATEDNVFLGNIDGLFTKPISFWRTRKGQSGMGRPAFEVVSEQAHAYMQNGHTIIDIINEIEDMIA